MVNWSRSLWAELTEAFSKGRQGGLCWGCMMLALVCRILCCGLGVVRERIVLWSRQWRRVCIRRGIWRRKVFHGVECDLKDVWLDDH